jgi:dephospho-CoA kinase
VLLVGLTGGIGSGKSTVAERLVAHGAELIDADLVAREVTLPGTEAWRQIVEHFGEGVLAADEFVDRDELGRVVFADPDKRTLLNEITHPPVMQRMAERLEELAEFTGVVVVDVPLLIETGAEVGYEAVVVVATYPETQVARLVADRGMAEEQARARVEAQASLEDKLGAATHVVWNEGDTTQLAERADELAAELTERARAKIAEG